MAAPAVPSGYFLQQANGKAFLMWDIAVGATSYQVQRSTDGVSFSTIASPTTNYYEDTTVLLGVQYYFQVAATNSDGSSPYTAPQTVVPTLSADMSLGQLRLESQQRADRVNSQFVTLPEWNAYINQSMFELYDILITAYEDYYIAPPAYFTTASGSQQYNLPNGINVFQDETGANYVPENMYKLVGVDLGLNNANNGFVTVSKFNFIDRNKYVYPNTASTIYGVFNMQYRVMGDKLQLIPAPSANQPMRLWFIPTKQQLLKDTDILKGFSGWTEYIIVDAAIKALQKEESDVSVLMAQKVALKQRIQEAASNRDAGQPDRISDTRGMGGFMGSGYGNGSGFGPLGGF